MGSTELGAAVTIWTPWGPDVAMNLEMVELPYWPGNASDYSEGSVLLLHTMESGGVCPVSRGFTRTSLGTSIPRDNRKQAIVTTTA